jgi:hypothetical protein
LGVIFTEWQENCQSVVFFKKAVCKHTIKNRDYTTRSQNKIKWLCHIVKVKSKFLHSWYLGLIALNLKAEKDTNKVETEV